LLYTAACAAREHLGRVRRAAYDGGDLVEGNREHVVQHERDPLGRGERFEHHEQSETDRVGQQRFALWVGPIRAAHDRLGQVRARGLA
jgi:hypothetical protein